MIGHEVGRLNVYCMQTKKARIFHLFDWAQCKWIIIFPLNAQRNEWKKESNNRTPVPNRERCRKNYGAIHNYGQENGNRFTWNCIIGFVCNQKTTRFFFSIEGNNGICAISTPCIMATISLSPTGWPLKWNESATSHIWPFSKKANRKTCHFFAILCCRRETKETIDKWLNGEP